VVAISIPISILLSSVCLDDDIARPGRDTSTPALDVRASGFYR
jgi:hypothetical protein